MGEQLIVAIGREFGSGGHEIGEKIAKSLGINFYDRNLLDHMAEVKNLDVEKISKYDEKPRKFTFSRSVNGHTTSAEQNLANLQFDFLREKAESGESFVIVGRCGECVLKDRPEMVSIFVIGDEACKTKRIMERYNLTESEALSKRRRHDAGRKRYHNQYSDYKWGDSREYDICINSSRLGVDGTVDALLEYIDRRKNKGLA